MDNQETLGQLIKRLRKERKWTQPYFADKANIDRSHLSMIETDKRPNPTKETLEKLAKAFDLPVAILLKSTLPQSSSTTLEDIGSMLKEMKANLQVPSLVKVPSLGNVPCGQPWTLDNIPVEYAYVQEKAAKGIQNPYVLQASGDSLAGFGIHDGSMLLIDRDAPLEDGHVYIICIGQECAAKKVYHENHSLKLVGSNCEFTIHEPQEVKSFGRVVRYIGDWIDI